MDKGMPVSKPYRRTIRQFIDHHYAEGGRWKYIRHPRFATEPEHYVRAFAIIQKDLLELFDFVEPADTNLSSSKRLIDTDPNTVRAFVAGWIETIRLHSYPQGRHSSAGHSD